MTPGDEGSVDSMRKTIAFIAVFFLVMQLSGCGGSSVTSTGKLDPQTPLVEQSAPETARKTYSIGERAIIDDRYAITIFSVVETKDRNPFSDKEVAQVLIIDYQYENIADENSSLYISDMDFKCVDEEANMCSTYPVSGRYSPEHTPPGARTLASMVFGTVTNSKTIKLYYYDNMFDTEPTAEFECEVGKSVEPTLDGNAPDYPDMYSVGDMIQINTTNGEYRLCIDKVERVVERNPFSEKQPKEVYRVTYTYSNVSLGRELFISDMDFVVLDGNGNTGFTYPGEISYHPQSTIKGAKCTAQMVFGVHTETDRLILCYRDNMFSDRFDLMVCVSTR